MSAPYPFSAIVGMAELRLGLLLNAVNPAVGGVLVRGEKGTAKSTAVRALAGLLPPVGVVAGCRFSCDPLAPDPACPDGPHEPGRGEERPARIVELPVGASDDRVVGSLDIERALAEGVKAFEPGLLAQAHRGVLYVDEVNLLGDHLIDVLLDAAAMGANFVEREGVSVRHAARFLLVGTMNPEEGELRPQLLDRFGLTVEVAAPRERDERVEIVRRRLAYDAGPASFASRWADEETSLRSRVTAARALLPSVVLGDPALRQIAATCSAFEVDGMRADIVMARTATALAAWSGRTEVRTEDIRQAALLALPHRRRRSPFDAPGLDESTLDETLREEDDPDPDGPGAGGGGGRATEAAGDQDPQAAGDRAARGAAQAGAADRNPPAQPSPAEADAAAGDQAARGEGSRAAGDRAARGAARAGAADPNPPAQPAPGDAEARPAPGDTDAQPATPTQPFRARRLEARGVGEGPEGHRSRARTNSGRTTGSRRPAARPGRLHLPATIQAAAPHQRSRGRTAPGLKLRREDLREALREGRESNLVLFTVDASGSMAARQRMSAVKGAVLSLLLDAYQRRDKVGLISFRGTDATLTLPPTSSVEAAAAHLNRLPTGGRTPLAAGLLRARDVLRVEHLRDPARRPLLVVVTDGRATGGPDPLQRALRAAGLLAADRTASVVVDCETGPVRLGLAGDLAAQLGGGPAVALDDLRADAMTALVHEARRAA